MGKCYPTVSEEYMAVVAKAKRKLRGLIAEKNCALSCSASRKPRFDSIRYIHLLSIPHLTPAAYSWHSVGTARTGGPFGTMKNPTEQAHGTNAGLDIIIRLLEPIKEQLPLLSYADFYQDNLSTPIHFQRTNK
uniref:Uncharacterized protein n=1 Tax=Oryza brachyantha TaxID=4533 RepID=J3MDE3_ORYBR